MPKYREWTNDQENKALDEIESAQDRLKARNREYSARKRKIIHAATERRRRAESQSKN